jgi:soluble lytic murein transglycosylase
LKCRGLKFYLYLAAYSGVVFSVFMAQAQPDPYMSFRAYLHNPNSAKNGEGAIKNLQAIYDAEKTPAVRAKEAFALGIIYYRKGDSQKAATYLGESINLKTHVDDFAHFFIGEIERDNKDLNGAKLHFLTVKNHQPPSSKEAEAEIEITKIDITQSRWNDAYSLLSHLERKHRGDPQYQEIVYNLIEASLQSHHKVQACQAAIKLYSRYATYSLSKGWGFDISKVKVGTQNLNCRVAPRDRDKRFEQLIISGELEEVRNEVKDWLNSSPNEAPQVEAQLGQLALVEGKIQDAIGHFSKAQEKLKNNFAVQMMLSRAYSQTDNYSQAVGSYLKSYELMPHTRKGMKQGLKALFQAAFLGYQYKDYDGAARNFDEVVKRGSGQIVLDAKWHLAWISYLKGHYDEAKRDFIDLAKNKHYSTVDLEKLLYWRGMAEFRDGNIEGAKGIFTTLASRPRLGYYTGAALARLASPAFTAPVLTPTLAPTTQAPQAPNASSPNATVAPNDRKADPPAAPVKADSARKPASEETLSGQKEEQKLDEEPAGDEEEISSEENGQDLLPPPITSLKSHALAERFDRARDLIDLGLDSWAIGELREIERRTTNHTYLQNLMAEYLKAGNYFRSAYIGDVVFQSEREEKGIDAANQDWRYAFPQAFAHAVLQDSKSFDLSPSFVWGIMRGESGYREDIHSTAGALGLMQLITPTAKKIAHLTSVSNFETSMLLDPTTNILLGTKYLQRLSQVMGGNIALVSASYNAGPHRVGGWVKDFGDLDMDEFIEHIPYMETRNYVKKVLRNYLVYETLYGKKADVLQLLVEKPGVHFDGPKRSSEDWGDIKD